jgi:KUP system potassium uptake protein
VLALVFTFKSAEALAYAFGMAVTGTITITTLLYFYVVRHQWGKPRWLVAAGACPLLATDLLFLAANVAKIPHGAWLRMLIAVAVFTVLVTWQQGRALVTRLRKRDEGPLRDFVDQLHARRPPLHRVPGTAVFLNRGRPPPRSRCARTSSTTRCLAGRLRDGQRGQRAVTGRRSR